MCPQKVDQLCLLAFFNKIGTVVVIVVCSILAVYKLLAMPLVVHLSRSEC